MKILFLSQGYKIEDQIGWDCALKRLKEEGFIEDYLNVPWRKYFHEKRMPEFYDLVFERTKAERFDIVYFHYFHAPRMGAVGVGGCMEALRALPHHPIILTSSGDGFSADWWHPPTYPKGFRDACAHADITFSTQMGKAADNMVRWGARNVVYTPNSMCPVRFKAWTTNPIEHKFDFDIVMIGNNNLCTSMNPFSRNVPMGLVRWRLVHALCSRFGKRFAIFGSRWGNLVSAQGPCRFDLQQETYRRGRIIVGGTPFSMCDYYSSNRLFFEISSGIPTVEMRVPRLDKIVRDGDQVYFADSVKDIVAKCEWLLHQDSTELYYKSSQAAKEIEKRHTQYHRMKFKLDTVKRYLANGRKLSVEFPFFLPEVDVAQELPFATRMGK